MDRLATDYNFCRVHKTSKQTPAMASGIANRVWTLGDLLAWISHNPAIFKQIGLIEGDARI